MTKLVQGRLNKCIEIIYFFAVANCKDRDVLHFEKKNSLNFSKFSDYPLGKTENVPWVNLPAKD